MGEDSSKRIGFSTLLGALAGSLRIALRKTKSPRVADNLHHGYTRGNLAQKIWVEVTIATREQCYVKQEELSIVGQAYDDQKMMCNSRKKRRQ